jgi:CRISPR type I-E-associated protein CasB/Cse2
MAEQELDPKITQFIENLQGLSTGERARLKRNAGNTLAEARQAGLGLFYRILPHGVYHNQEETYFLVATLYPLAEDGKTGNLGGALRLAQDVKNKEGLNRRVEILLDADETQIPFRLRQAVQFLYSNRIPVNWGRLLNDMLYWNHEKRFVQQQWARSFFAR